MLKRILLVLTGVAIVLGITLCSVLCFAAILGAMGDEVGRVVLHWVASALGILLVVDLICLLLALAVHTVEGPGEPPDERETG